MGLPERRSDERSFEQGAENAVVEERPAREWGSGAVQDEDDPLPSHPSRECRSNGKQVTSAVEDDNICSSHLPPEGP